MFAPTKIWRRWHRRPPLNQRRYALTSALAGSSIPALVLARGHRVEQIAEVPLVLDSKAFDNVVKSKDAVALLKAVNAYADVQKAKDSHAVRAGQGKNRNRRFIQRRGPLLVHTDAETTKLYRAFRNLSGVETARVDALNLLQLAPGGHVGRFVVWTKDAFAKLDKIYGTYHTKSSHKVNYRLPRTLMTNPDISRIINSDEVQGSIRPRQPKLTKVHAHRKNPLTNAKFRLRLNPNAKHSSALAQQKRVRAKKATKAVKKAITKRNKAFKTDLLAAVAYKQPAKKVVTKED